MVGRYRGGEEGGVSERACLNYGFLPPETRVVVSCCSTIEASATEQPRERRDRPPRTEATWVILETACL